MVTALDYMQQDTRAMTEGEFLTKYLTSRIGYGAYEGYQTRKGIEWLGGKHEYPVYVKTFFTQRGNPIEFWKSGEHLQYVRTDPKTGEIVRDEKGLATYITDAEALAEGYPIYDTTIVAFNAVGPIGWVANEFGVPGVWVVEQWQGQGIGLELLIEHLKLFNQPKYLGQYTYTGEMLARALYRRLRGMYK